MCSDRLDGALGAKIVQSCGEVVLIQGVNREWFLFAYRRAACNEAEAPIDARDLDQLNRRLEASLL